jgi:phosphatidate phosphatase PAH1
VQIYLKFHILVANDPDSQHSLRRFCDIRFGKLKVDGEQILFIVPLGNDQTHHMMIFVNPDAKQIVIDVFSDGMIKQSDVFAADMAKPMCPMFKQ